MVNLEQFRLTLISDVRAEALENMQYPTMQYLETVTNGLSIYDKCPVAVPCFYERTGRRNRKILIHGYNYDDFDNSLSLFVCDFSGNNEMKTITKTTFKDYVNHAVAFIEDSLSGDIENSSDSSDDGYGLAQDIRKSKDKIERYFIYVISDSKRSDQFNTFEEKNIDGKNLICRILDIEYYYDALLENSEPDSIVIDVKTISGIDGIPCMDASIGETDFKSYLSVMPGTFLAKIYKEYGSKLLDSNVRSYLGLKGDTNKGIRKTIQETPELFFAYNNGITTTATSIKRDDLGRITEFENLQIVNGGQTTVSIYNEWKKNNLSIDAVYVPMKLTVATPEEAKKIVPNISRYANTQNAVKKSDLDSNTEFQKMMQYYSRNTRIPQSNESMGSKKWYYERTRNQFNTDPDNVNDSYNFKRQYDKKRKIDKLDFAKYRYIIEMRPDLVAKGREEYYNKYFKIEVAKQWEENKEYYNVNYFKETIAMVILYKQVYSEIPKREWFNGRSSIKAPLTFYPISKILYELSQRDRRLDLLKIWEEQRADDVVIRQIVSAAKVFCDYLDFKIIKEGKLATQWVKKPECWEEVRQLHVDFDNEILNYSITDNQYKSSYKKAETIEKEVNVNTMKEAVFKNPLYWKQLQMWFEKNLRSLTAAETTLVTRAINKNTLSEYQINKLQSLVEEAKSNGFVDISYN
jgi:hypothetical protein